MPQRQVEVQLSVVAPAHNEEGNLAALVREITAAIEPLGLIYEIVLVDDGSTDGSATVLESLLHEQPRLRVIRMADCPPGRGQGQSAAFHAAFRAARGRLIAVLDADLQNDPADLPGLLRTLEETGADMVQGDRTARRREGLRRAISTLVGRWFRRLLLGDTIRDTGCSLRVLTREAALRLPLEFRGIHRFIPVTVRRLGYTVIEVPVNHRPRRAGVPKYGMLDRAAVGLWDCLAVRWMLRRRRSTSYVELPSPPLHEPPARAPSSFAGRSTADASARAP
jgi:glycosyltransferase involved in cell wall biosynthesis